MTHPYHCPTCGAFPVDISGPGAAVEALIEAMKTLMHCDQVDDEGFVTMAWNAAYRNATDAIAAALAARTPTTSAQVCRRCGGTDMYAEVWTCRQCGPEP